MVERITFVVGAGASTEFDRLGIMPIGSRLAVQIEDLLVAELRNYRSQNPGPVADALMRSGGLRDEHVAAMRRIRDGILSRDSIDDFVNEWSDIPELTRVAKLCIAYRMLEAERKSVLGALAQPPSEPAQLLRELRNSWLGLITRQLNPQARRRDVEAVFEGASFVTFNYDRCIEQFLLATFTSTHALSPGKAAEAVRGIPILHAYGSLGDIPHEGSGVPFAAEDIYLSKAALQIKTFNEDVGSEHRIALQGLVGEADKVIFLGCGYHSQNLRLLYGDSPPNRESRVWGTTVGMRGRPLQNASNYFSGVRNSTFEPIPCAEFLSRFDDSIFEEQE